MNCSLLGFFEIWLIHCFVMCDGPPSHLNSFWVLTGGLKLLAREELQLSMVLCGHTEKMAVLYEEGSCASIF